MMELIKFNLAQKQNHLLVIGAAHDGRFDEADYVTGRSVGTVVELGIIGNPISHVTKRHNVSPASSLPDPLEYQV
jgi:hypothetical protein